MTTLTSTLGSVDPLGFLANLTRDYVSQNISVTWGGIPFTGFKDNFFNAILDEDNVNLKKGIDGNVAYIGKSPSTLTISISLEAMSDTNKFLWNIVKLQQEQVGEVFKGSLIIKDISTGQMLTGVNTILQTPSNLSYGKTHTDIDRTWLFRAEKAKISDNIY